MRGLVFAVACGALSGITLALLSRSGIGVVVAYFVPLPLFFAGFAFGPLTAAIAAMIGAAVVGMIEGAVVWTYVLGFAAPVVIVVRQALLSRQVGGDETGGAETGGTGPGETALEWYPSGQLLLWLTGIGLFGFVVALAVTMGTPDGLPGVFRPALERLAGAMPGLSAEPEALTSLSHWLPALIVGSWVVMMVVNGTWAQGLAVRFKMNVRPSPHYAALALPRIAAPLLAIGLVVGWLGGESYGYIGWTLAVALSVGYFLQGLAVLHWLVQQGRMPGFLLWVIYGGMTVFGGLGVLVVMLGLFEEWAGLRRRLSGSRSSQEED